MNQICLSSKVLHNCKHGVQPLAITVGRLDIPITVLFSQVLVVAISYVDPVTVPVLEKLFPPNLYCRFANLFVARIGQHFFLGLIGLPVGQYR